MAPRLTPQIASRAADHRYATEWQTWRTARQPGPAPCMGRCAPKRMLLVPTLLILVVAAMIAKVAFIDAPNPQLARGETAPSVVTATPGASETATPAATTPKPAAIVEPPACVTPLPSGVCRTELPACPDVQGTPGVLCRWPRDPAAPPH